MAARRRRFIESGGRCGTVDDLPSEGRRSNAPTVQSPRPLQTHIPIAFHIFYREQLLQGELVRDGLVSLAQIDSQVSVLNAAYSSMGVTFSRLSVDSTNSAEWFNMRPRSTTEADAKQALAVNPSRALNVYTAGLEDQYLLGWSYFPWAFPENSPMHGVVLLYSSLPGGASAPYDQGQSATHEIGHYLGLYHTFEGGCQAPGDFVADTPPQAWPTYGCPQDNDSCPAPGTDPVHNYLGYSDDDCMYEFTPGQRLRVAWALRTYKPTLAYPASARGRNARENEPTKGEGIGSLESTVHAGTTAGGAAVGAAGTLNTATTAELPVHVVSAFPFRPNAFEFALPHAARVSLTVFDVAGRRVATLLDGERPAGPQHVHFASEHVPSGVYFAVLRFDQHESTQRLLVLR